MKRARNGYLNEDLVELLHRYETIIHTTPRARLRETLEAAIDEDKELLEIFQRDFIEDQRSMEELLWLQGKIFSKALKLGRNEEREKKDRFRMITKCNKCADSKRESIKRGSRETQEHTVGRYIFESEFFAVDLAMPDLAYKGENVYEALGQKGFHFKCKLCESPLEIISTSNIIVPLEEGPVKQISMRSKSAARYCQKLVHQMFLPKFREIEPDEKSRTLTDKYGIAVLINYAPSKPAQLKKLFKSTFGYTLPGLGDTGDEACYGVHHMLKKLPEGYGRRNLQNNIASPIEKVSKLTGSREQYKMLQFPIILNMTPEKTVEFEAQIKTHHTYLREQDEKCAYSHHTYSERENEKRLTLWREVPESFMVYDALLSMFAKKPREPTGSIRIQR